MDWVKIGNHNCASSEEKCALVWLKILNTFWLLVIMILQQWRPCTDSEGGSNKNVGFWNMTCGYQGLTERQPFFGERKGSR